MFLRLFVKVESDADADADANTDADADADARPTDVRRNVRGKNKRWRFLCPDGF